MQLGLPYDVTALSEMARYLGIGIDELLQRYYGRRSDDGKHLIFDEGKQKPCPFLVSEGSMKTCKIYPVRPQGCRAYPFDTDFGRNGVDCPGASEVYVKRV